MDYTARRDEEHKLWEFYAKNKAKGGYAFALMELSCENLPMFKKKFPELSFEKSFNGNTAVTFRN